MKFFTSRGLAQRDRDQRREWIAFAYERAGVEPNHFERSFPELGVMNAIADAHGTEVGEPLDQTEALRKHAVDALDASMVAADAALEALKSEGTDGPAVARARATMNEAMIALHRYLFPGTKESV